MSKQHQTQMQAQYWKGFKDGMTNSLKHNICLLKSQLEKQKIEKIDGEKKRKEDIKLQDEVLKAIK